jgi:2-polyprenyl-3-methyl-5-hydroxy-6-metoxy-1,4-benzoquinol methylase
MERLSQNEYWQLGYRRRKNRLEPPDLNDFRNFATKRVVQTLESVGLAGKRVLEVGAGDSEILLLLAKRLAGVAQFAGMDYSDAGCELLRDRSSHLGAEIEVINSDLFQPPKELIGRFDLVYSVGLVEHFGRLGDVLAALTRFLRPGGELVTIIPNMHGLLGTLTKRWNRAVYEIHNPYSLSTFLAGHADAGLGVVRSGYLCSSNFGVLSACFEGGAGQGARAYSVLSRLSKGLWWYESRVFELPKTAWFSPYIYAISRAIMTRNGPVHE